MSMSLQENLNKVKDSLGEKGQIIIKELLVGFKNPIEAALIYMNGIADKEMIDRDLLSPLMTKVIEEVTISEELPNYLFKRYITVSSGFVINDYEKISLYIKSGKSAIILDGVNNILIVDTTKVPARPIQESANETTLRGSREGFVENIEINLGIMKNRIKDKDFTIDTFLVGRRSKKSVALMYIKSLSDDELVSEITNRINAIDVDTIPAAGYFQQLIEDYTYTVFPQAYNTERPDVVEANIMEGRVAVIIDGTPVALIYPAMIAQFFQAIEDYSQRTVVSSAIRLMRFFATFIVITFPSIYLTLIKFNSELIPAKFITPIVESRTGIALTPFLEILCMEIIVELLREGGLRLPGKIGQTLSVVGGIIIGDAAVQSKIVSPTTLLVIGVSVVSSFLIPNYDMSGAIRMLRFPMLLLADTMGVLGITIGWYFIFINVGSLDSMGASYLELNKSDMKDIFIRVPIWKMNKRPEIVPNKDNTRQSDFRWRFKRKQNGK